jgi:hypothetical protein
MCAKSNSSATHGESQRNRFGKPSHSSSTTLLAGQFGTHKIIIPLQSGIKDRLRRGLVGFLGDRLLLKAPLSLLVRVVDFRNYANTPTSFSLIFTFCVRYFNADGPVASQLFRTLDVMQLTMDSYLEQLCALDGLHWCFLNGADRLGVIERGDQVVL